MHLKGACPGCHFNFIILLCAGITMPKVSLSVLRERNLSGETRGMDYFDPLDLLAITCGRNIKLIRNMGKRTPIDSIDSQHGCPTIANFNVNYKNKQISSDIPSHVIVADNDGPVDVYDIQKKSLLRSYLEHGSRVTGLTWAIICLQLS